MDRKLVSASTPSSTGKAILWMSVIVRRVRAEERGCDPECTLFPFPWKGEWLHPPSGVGDERLLRHRCSAVVAVHWPRSLLILWTSSVGSPRIFGLVLESSALSTLPGLIFLVGEVVGLIVLLIDKLVPIPPSLAAGGVKFPVK